MRRTIPRWRRMTVRPWTGKPRTPHKKVQREKNEQQQIRSLLIGIGCDVLVKGTRQQKGVTCPSCQTFVPTHQGTRQTEGQTDLDVFMPRRGTRREFIVIEVKHGKNTMSVEQRKVRDLYVAAGIPHIDGDYNAVVEWLIRNDYIAKDSVPWYRQPEAP